jgi:hypothetical protein
MPCFPGQTQNIENNPMQSRMGLAAEHAATADSLLDSGGFSG